MPAQNTSIKKAAYWSSLSPEYREEFRKRFYSRTERQENGCLVSSYAKSEGGYAFCNFGRMKSSAHMMAWIMHHGGYDKDLQIDHICGTRDCVEIEHLRLLTHEEHAVETSKALDARRAEIEVIDEITEDTILRGKNKTHCSKGHRLTEENKMYRKCGRVACRPCHRTNVRKSYHRHAQALKPTQPVEGQLIDASFIITLGSEDIPEWTEESTTVDTSKDRKSSWKSRAVKAAQYAVRLGAVALMGLLAYSN